MFKLAPTGRRVAAAAVCVAGLAAPTSQAALPPGFIGNAQLCSGQKSVPLYTDGWRVDIGPGGLDAVPSNYGSASAERWTSKEPIAAVPTVLSERFVRVARFANGNLRMSFASRDQLCVARVGVPAAVKRLAAGRRVPDLRILDKVNTNQLAATVKHLTHIPAAAQDAFAARGAFGNLTGSASLAGVPGYLDMAAYPAFSSLMIMRPEDSAGVAVGPGLTVGFGGTISDESGSNSTALHEFGHVYDLATNRVLTTDWLTQPYAEADGCAAGIGNKTSYAKSTPFEWYAETFAQYLLNPVQNAQLKRACPVTWAYHRATLGVPAF